MDGAPRTQASEEGARSLFRSPADDLTADERNGGRSAERDFGPSCDAEPDGSRHRKVAEYSGVLTDHAACQPADVHDGRTCSDNRAFDL